MELRQLHYFFVLANLLNFSKAAEQLHITQPTLSQQITSMERELGKKLLIRNTRTVSLTQSGKQLLECAEPLVRALDDVLEDIHRNDTPQHGKHLVIGMDHTVNELRFFGADIVLAALGQRNPELSIDVVSSSFFELEQALKEHRFDVGLYLTYPKIDFLPHGFSARELRRDKLMYGVGTSFCKKNKNADIFSVLTELPVCLFLGDNRWNTRICDMMKKYNPNIQTRYMPPSPAYYELIENGFGIMVDMEKSFRMRDNKKIRYFDFPDKTFEVASVAVIDSSISNPLVDEFLNLLAENG